MESDLWVVVKWRMVNDRFLGYLCEDVGPRRWRWRRRSSSAHIGSFRWAHEQVEILNAVYLIEGLSFVCTAVPAGTRRAFR